MCYSPVSLQQKLNFQNSKKFADGIIAEQSRNMDQGPEIEYPEIIMGSSTMENEMAALVDD